MLMVARDGYQKGDVRSKLLYHHCHANKQKLLTQDMPSNSTALRTGDLLGGLLGEQLTRGEALIWMHG